MAEPKKVNNGNVFDTQADGSVISKLVGTFTPSVTIGEYVRINDMLGTVSTLGTDHEVFAEIAGYITVVGVSDDHPIEFGQILIVITPSDTPPPPTNSRVKKTEP